MKKYLLLVLISLLLTASLLKPAPVRPLEWVGHVIQSNTDDPFISIEYQDDLNLTFTCNYIETGSYECLTASPVFTTNKTAVFVGRHAATSDRNVAVASNSTTRIGIINLDMSGNLTDEMEIDLLIKVYP